MITPWILNQYLQKISLRSPKSKSIMLFLSKDPPYISFWAWNFAFQKYIWLSIFETSLIFLSLKCIFFFLCILLKSTRILLMNIISLKETIRISLFSQKIILIFSWVQDKFWNNRNRFSSHFIGNHIIFPLLCLKSFLSSGF